MSLILLNAVFRLGIPEKSCKADVIKNNDWVRKTSVNKKLESLEKILERHRPIRNLYIHRGLAPGLHEVFQSEMMDYLHLIAFVHLHSEPIIDRKLLDLAYKGQINSICKKLDTEISAVREAIWHLFDSLLPTYEGIARSLRQ